MEVMIRQLVLLRDDPQSARPDVMTTEDRDQVLVQIEASCVAEQHVAYWPP